ncbi:MAG TPA: ABC transporter substrate-binding protein [Streptosporangiaceae bacterium]|nr:ABC transporter substrate-binding protein [Streptosporangiaceae bacterium]
MKLSPRLLIAGTGVLALAAVGCSSSAGPQSGHSDSSPAASAPAGSRPAGSPSARPVGWSAATSAAAGGGMTALIAAARKEGTLNVIGLPASWANYGAIMKTFSKRYGIRIHSIAPGDRSPQEITEIRQDNGTAGAADVLDIEMSVAVADSKLFAPYQVATWQAIPASQKAPDGAWVQDYGGFMSVGYNSARFGRLTSLRQLLGHRFSRAVALDGNPAQANAALYGVMMANLALGGTANSIASGVAFFRKLKSAGNFVPVLATTPLTIEAGSTPVVFNWDYLNTAAIVGQPARSWKVFIPAGAAVGEFHAQAINKDAPHPAAARLWEEFLYSQTRRGGQNLWLEGGVRPVEQAAMIANGSIDAAASHALPPGPAAAVFLTPGQAASAAAYLHAHWSRAVG